MHYATKQWLVLYKIIFNCKKLKNENIQIYGKYSKIPVKNCINFTTT